MLVLSLTGTATAQDPANGAPTATFTVEPDPPTAGSPATLDAAPSTDPDGDTLSYAWDLDGDGTIDDAGQTIEHTFADPGDVEVVLTVDDGNGGSDEERRTLTVNAAPTADIAVTPADPPHVGETWGLDGSGSQDPDASTAPSDPAPLTFAWDLGDGTVADTASVEHAYDAPGTYTITLVVTDADGASGEASVQVVVDNRAPTAALTVTPTDATAGQEVTFDASGSQDPDGQALTYAWDIDGDREVDVTTDVPTLVTPYDRNTQDGPPFAATVTVSDGELEAVSPPVEVTVANAAPTPLITLAPGGRIDTTTDVTLDATGSTDVEAGELSHAWDLGDGTTSDQPSVTHRYTRPGSYTVTLTVTDSDGGSATVSRVIEVLNAPPVIVVLPADPQGRPGETITLDASTSFDPDGTELTFRWDPQGRPTATGPTTTVSYDEEGVYEVLLTVVDGDGVGSSASIRVKVDNDLVFRVAGRTRVETGVALSQRAFDTATQAVLARADDFPDALAASTLAAEVDGPILLTSRSALAEPVVVELDRLNATHVYLAGGQAALGPEIEAALIDRGIAFTRLAGSNRYETAAAIAREVVRLGGPVQEAILALGTHAQPARAWPDALVAGNLATAGRAPILLVSGSTLPSATAEALTETVDGTRVWIAGGEGAVGRAVERAVEARGWDVRRLAGPDRYGTGVVVADEARRRGAGAEPVVLASGRNFPDALAASVTAWKLGGVLLLIDPNDLLRSDPTYAWLRFHREAVDTVLLAGGASAVGDHPRRQVEDRIQDGRTN